MPLAAPLILPFAELAGITIAGLGMAAASEKVGDFISENPELSKQILITLVPGGAGLNTLFKKEAGITLEDLDEMTDEEAADLSKEDKAGIMKEVGKSKGGDKRQRMIEISEKLGLSGEGKEKQTIIDEVEERYDEGGVEDAPKPKFDYKKFFRNRNADGGAIGIEVLLEEKKDGGRIGFANGGIENIIGKNLDNVTNVAKGLDKEMLDMTFDDKYYRDVIQPAKLGQAPIPGRMEMMLKSKPFTAVGIGMRPGTFGERAQPTKAASQFLNTLGKGAKFVGTKVGPLSFMDLFASTPLGADDMVTQEMRDSIEVSPTSTTGIMVDANEGFRTPTRTNVQGMDLEMDPGARINPDIQPSLNMFQRAGNFIGELDLEDYLPFVGEKSLTRMLGQGVGNLFRGIAPARYGYSTDRFNRMTPGQQSYTSSLYGPGGLLQGYNQRSAFGLGALGTLGNRLTAIQNRRAPQTAASLARQQEIKDAINRTINTGESEALSDRNRSVDYGITGGRTRTDIDVADGGAESGGGGKIVCTMMNESYGFGNFRNKIWLKHSRDLPKEYEIGYHTIFLPLVKFAKGEGKLNKVVKKTLEHIARHRTLDLKQEMKGKTHALGRVYRKILEPICLMVGKIKKAVK